MSTGSVTWGLLGSLKARLLPQPPCGKQGLVTQYSWQSHSLPCSFGGRKGINQLLILRECTVKELVSAGGCRESSCVTVVSHRLVYSYVMAFCLLQSLFSVKFKAGLIIWSLRKNAMLACLEALHELFYLQLGHAPPPIRSSLPAYFFSNDLNGTVVKQSLNWSKTPSKWICDFVTCGLITCKLCNACHQASSVRFTKSGVILKYDVQLNAKADSVLKWIFLPEIWFNK